MAKSYVKFETPADVQAKVLEIIEGAKNSGSVRKGTNETTKAIERGDAKLVVIAEDVDPEEIVMHLPSLCEEKKIAFVYIAEKTALGKAAGLTVGTAAVAVTKAGSAEAALKEVLAKTGAPVAEKAEKTSEPVKVEKKPAAKKAAAKKEKPVEEPKAVEASAEAAGK